MTIVKLKNLKLKNFMHFRHADIELLDDTTLINGYKQSPEVLSNFVLAFKFILNSSDIPENDIKRFNGGNDLINEMIYVEAHFSINNNTKIIFRKSIYNSKLIYELNNTLTTREKFKERLIDLGFELSISNTLLIDSQMIYRIANMKDRTRSDVIEQFCVTPELLARHQRVKDKMEDMHDEMKSFVDQKKEFKAFEVKGSIKVNKLQKLKKRNLHRQTQEFQLFQLYHYHRDYFELRPQNIENLKKALNEVKKDYGSTLMAYRIATEIYLMYDRLWKESNDVVRDACNIKFHLEQLCEINQQEVMMLELRNSNNFENIYLSSIKREVENNNITLQGFQTLKDKYGPSYAEYIQLRNKVHENNQKLMTYYNNLKKVVYSDIYELEGMVKFFHGQIENFSKEDEFYTWQLTTIKDEQTDIMEDICNCKEYAKELESNYNKKKNSATLFESIILPFMSLEKSNTRIILEMLQEMFSPALVVGRLCDLFDVTTTDKDIIQVKHHQILERLGKFAEAIVVKSQIVADKCVEFLKIQQPQFNNGVVIPLTICKEVSTIEALKNFKLPEGIIVEPIEKFISAKHPEIHKLLMHILKPTLVCNSVTNAQIIFAAVYMKIQVTCIESHLTYKPGAILQIHLRHAEQSQFADETFVIIRENLQEVNLEVIELSSEIKLNASKLASYEHKKNIFDYYERVVISLQRSNLEAMKFGTKKVNEVLEVIKRLKNVENLDELKKKYEIIKKKMGPLDAQFFKDFLLKYDYESTEDYELEVSKIFPTKVYQCQLKFFNARKEFYERTRFKLLRHAPDNEAEILQNAKDRLNISKEFLDKSIETLDTIKMNNAIVNEKMKESLKKTLEKRAEINELERKIETMTEKLCNEFINIQIAIAENYRLLFFALVDCDKDPVKKGSLMKLLDILTSNEINEDFDLMQKNLDGLEINFEKLDEKLKSDLDIPKKKIDISTKLRQLKDFLDEFTLDVTGDNEKLQNFTQRLNRLIAETLKLTQDIQDVTEKFQNVGNDRTRRFNECLKVINGEIGKFGTIAMRGKAHGELKASNINEPYTSDIFYTWHMENKHEEHVNDLNLNYEAAFAFLMGLIKYKKQQFVILSDSAKVMLNDFDLKSLLDYLKSDTNFQIVAVLANKTNQIEEHCSYYIKKLQNRCIVLSNL